MKGKVKKCTNRYCGAKFAVGILEKDDRGLYDKYEFRYCPVCGIKMDEGKD